MDKGIQLAKAGHRSAAPTIQLYAASQTIYAASLAHSTAFEAAVNRVRRALRVRTMHTFI